MGSKFTGDGAVDGKDDLYFLDFVQFRVQGTLFRVPTNGFTSSNPNFFKDIGVADQLLKNNVHEQVIELPEISRDMFKGLLLVMYPFTRTAETYDEWIGALHLAVLWGLSDVRTKAIAFISGTDDFKSKEPVEVIQLAKKLRVGSWLRDAYIRLVEGKDIDVGNLRPSSGSDPLDWETISLLFQAQSLFRKQPTGPAIDDAQCQCEGCLRQKRPHMKWGYEPVYRCTITGKTKKSVGTCVDQVFRQELTNIDPGLFSHSFAGERLALIQWKNLPDLNQRGPSVAPNEDIFLGSALLDSSVMPCFVTTGIDEYQEVFYFASYWADGEMPSEIFDVLPYSPERMEWVPTSQGKIPHGRQPISGGYDEEGRQLYHAGVPGSGLKLLGYTGEHLGKAMMTNFGAGVRTVEENYEILCWR
ncbi:hypothetical protein CPB83DRAFT_858855 [Crepidotus variabilis]|uniref:BTB domain-containing protein n=1 Tax=Crepidotus variabilis TaxID=179855 RepID=A0A9P6JM41_9AGAR|nr:hypothetical protein CPB83DRAFT_858855 [Crepidotus variabilis]